MRKLKEEEEKEENYMKRGKGLKFNLFGVSTFRGGGLPKRRKIA